MCDVVIAIRIEVSRDFDRNQNRTENEILSNNMKQ